MSKLKKRISELEVEVDQLHWRLYHPEFAGVYINDIVREILEYLDLYFETRSLRLIHKDGTPAKRQDYNYELEKQKTRRRK